MECAVASDSSRVGRLRTDGDLDIYNAVHNTSLVYCPEALDCGEDNVCAPVTESVPKWGYDNIFQALITGWVATTGDLWTVNMMGEITDRSIRYPGTAWWFFSILFFVLNMVVSNLFVAVVVESYIQNVRAS